MGVSAPAGVAADGAERAVAPHHGHTVGMHPLLVLLSLLIGAKLAGLWGAVFAVPVAGVIVAMVGFYRMTVEDGATSKRATGERDWTGSLAWHRRT